MAQTPHDEAALPATGEELAGATSEALAVAAQAGSRPSFEALVTRHHAGLFRYLVLRTGSAVEAEDLSQEAFLRAWQKLVHYRPTHRFTTWLYTLAARLAISGARKADPLRAARDLELGGALASDPAGDPARLCTAAEEKHNLWSIAATILTVDQREALWLRYVDGLSVNEVARVLGRLPVTVRCHLFRARRLLALRLAAVEDAGPEGALPSTPTRTGPREARTDPLPATSWGDSR